MAYRFADVTDYVQFNPAPLSGYAFGAVTMAAFCKPADVGTGLQIGIAQADTSTIAQLLFSLTHPALYIGNRADGPQTLSTTAWQIIVATRAAGSTGARLHVHDGTSWTHANFTSGFTDSSPPAVSGTSLFRVGRLGAFPLAADVVCVGVKKADSSDAQVETLGNVSFDDWRLFAFDWLIGFDASHEVGGLLQDQATPGTGDETGRSFVAAPAVADPAGWGWTSAPTVAGAGRFSKIRFGPSLDVTDEGGGVITVDSAAGGGGGALEWEDVGGPGGAVDYRVPYAIVVGSSITSSGGQWLVSWSSITDQFAPVPFVQIITATPHVLQLEVGVYRIGFFLRCDAAVAGQPDILWQFGGTATQFAGGHRSPGQYVSQGGGNYLPDVEMNATVKAAGGAKTLTAYALLGAGAALASPQAAATIMKLA